MAQAYGVWALGKFAELEIETMETAKQTIAKNVAKLGKQINFGDGGPWPCWAG